MGDCLETGSYLYDGARFPKIIASRFVKPQPFGELLAGKPPRSNAVNLLQAQKKTFW
jgi:hypothetical protein